MEHHEDDAKDDEQEVMEEEARKPDVHETFQVNDLLKIFIYNILFYIFFFRYISGVNKERQEIGMTVPVLSKMTPMDGKMNKQMCFYLTKEAQKNPPQPEDPAVKIEVSKEMVVFVKQFGG